MESNKKDVPSKSDDEPFDADIILQHLGNTGSFQFRFFICLAYAILFPMATILVFNFTGATPAHRYIQNGLYCSSATCFVIVSSILVIDVL